MASGIRRSVLCMDESWFTLYRADGRHHVWHCVGEWFADVNFVKRVAHGGDYGLTWHKLQQQTQVHFINANLNAQRYDNEILRPIVVPIQPPPSPHAEA